MKKQTKYVKLFEDFRQDAKTNIYTETKPLNEGFWSDTWENLKKKATDLYNRLMGKAMHLIKGNDILAQIKATFSGKEGGEELTPEQLNTLTPEFAKANNIDEISERYFQELIQENNSDKYKFKKFQPMNEAMLDLHSDSQIPDFSGAVIVDIIRKTFKHQVIRGLSGKKRPAVPLIVGAPGIGKTQLVGQIAEEFDANLLIISLSLMTKEDIIGVPSVLKLKLEEYDEKGNLISKRNELQNVTQSNPTSQLPFFAEKDPQNNTEEGRREIEIKYGEGAWTAKKPYIIFFDEITNAHETVLGAIKNFLQEYEIAGLKLPSNSIIVAAGNRPADEKARIVKNMFEISKAVGSRFKPMNFVPTMEEWVEWAKNQNKKYKEQVAAGGIVTATYVLPEIIEFLVSNSTNNEYGAAMYNAETDSTGQFATPRGWVQVSDELLVDAESNGGSAEDWYNVLSYEDIQNTVIVNLGEKAAMLFMSYIQVIREIKPEVAKVILTNPMEVPLIPSLDPKKFMNNGEGLNLQPFLGMVNYLTGLDEVTGAPEGEQVKMLYNIALYMTRSGQLEVTTAGFGSLRAKFPILSPFNPDNIDNKLDDESRGYLKKYVELINTTEMDGLKAIQDKVRKEMSTTSKRIKREDKV